jgi:hypothetical protein
MSSDINFASINENFPVAGQDNDTQVFRDNFDTIKNSLSTAKTEVTDLLENSARLDEDNDFSGNRIVNTVFRNVKGLKYSPSGIVAAADGEDSASTEINYENGMYQIYRFASDANINLAGLPTDNYAKMKLEIYGDGTARTLTFVSVGGTAFKKNESDGWIQELGESPKISVDSSVDPVIVEVWRHDSNKIFLNYLGEFN